MASTTRGSIKISTANGIGAALVDVLGGEGYKPDEWEQNINICGIHAADIESALENIEEDAGTGTERGSILLSTANAIGATLNKKFNTSRGFSPREWASATSKLEPLPERTASGAIASITNGADGVPVKNWLVTLPASLSGYSSIAGTKNTGTGTPETQYTASLGRTIYGGTADIVTGEGEETFGKLVLSSENMNIISRVNANKYRVFNADFGAEITGSDYATNILVSGGSLRPQTGSSNDDRCYINASGDFRMNFTNEYASVADMIADVGTITLIYPLATPSTFTFTPITPTPETALGVNNFWSDQGESAVTYRKDLDIPDPVPGNLLGMNNANNNEEESEG